MKKYQSKDFWLVQALALSAYMGTSYFYLAGVSFRDIIPPLV